jgi:hypothetical protein
MPGSVILKKDIFCAKGTSEITGPANDFFNSRMEKNSKTAPRGISRKIRIR